MRKIYLSLLTLILSILLISGCSSDEEESADLVVAFSAEPLTVDPHDADDSMSNQANNILYDKLVTFDKDNNIVPELATEWDISEDGMQITFTLRDDVDFQDGTPFNAEAVKLNFERVLDEDNKLARHSLYADFIDNVVVDDEYQITFEFSQPYGPALTAFAHGAGGIVSPKAIEDNEDIDINPAGSGPYELKEWTPGNDMVFIPNENYWGTTPELDSITFKPVLENSSRSIMLENGEVDIISPVGTQDVERLQENSDIEVDLAPIYRNLYVSINTNKDLLQDVKVRQALNYAIDKESIINDILLGQGNVSDAAVSSSLPGYSAVGTYEYDPDKAKRLLDEAGVEEGTKIKLWTPDGRYIMDSKITEFIQSNLSEIGFDVEFQQWEWSAYSEELSNPESDFDLMLGSWGASTGDIDWGLRPTLSSTGSNNYGSYSNAEVDNLIEEGLKSPLIEDRIEIYNEAMSQIMEDAPWIFLLEYAQPVGLSKDVKGVYTLGNGYVILREASIDN